MAGFFKKLADRFRPSPIEQLEQSAAAKKKLREPRVLDVPHAQAPAPRLLNQSTLTNVDCETDMRGNTVWRQWHTVTSNNLTTGTGYSDPWQTWHNCGTQTTNTAIWHAWTVGGTSSAVTIQTTSYGANDMFPRWVEEADQRTRFNKESAAQKKRRQAEEDQYRAQREAENAKYYEAQRVAENKRKAAEERARGLLISMLDEQQRADLKRDSHFFVNAPSGRLYRIDYGSHGNVKVIDRKTRKVLERLCIQPDGVPAGDTNLMQKLLIETAEETFRAHANITLEDGSLIRGSSEPLTGDKLGKVIQLRRAA